MRFLFFFFNDPATTEIYTLSLHDALPISDKSQVHALKDEIIRELFRLCKSRAPPPQMRSEEHTSELQSQSNLVCRLLLEKKKKRHFVLASSHFCTSATHLHYRDAQTASTC